MKKLLLLILLVTSAAMGAYAQNCMVDAVHLKNGSVIRGVLIEQIPGETVKLRTKDGNIFVYKTDEIAKLTRERAGNNRYNPKQHGFKGIIEGGYGAGVGSNVAASDRAFATFTYGYQINPYFYAGLGTGAYYYPGLGGDITVPLFAHLRSDFLDRDFTPYFSVNVGYNFHITNNIHKGIMLEPTLGTSIRVSDKNSIHFGVGYALNYAELYYYVSDGFYGYLWLKKEPIHMITMRLGVTF